MDIDELKETWGCGIYLLAINSSASNESGHPDPVPKEKITMPRRLAVLRNNFDKIRTETAATREKENFHVLS